MPTQLNKIIFCIVGPSGSGKSTLIKALLQEHSDKFQQFFTVTDRPMRPYETQDNPYRFITPNEFDELIINQDFLEFERQEHNNYRYGKTKSLLNNLRDNKILLTELQIYKVDELRKALPDYKIYSLFIHVEDLKKMKERLLKRGDTEEVVDRRIEIMKDEGEKNIHLADFIIPSIENDIEKSVNSVIDVFKKITTIN